MRYSYLLCLEEANRADQGRSLDIAVRIHAGAEKSEKTRACRRSLRSRLCPEEQWAADEELWGITALLHDFDYERWPNDAHSPTEEHPAGGSSILRERGYSEEMIRAIVSHADYCAVARETPLEHTLFACDELAEFVTACSLVKPGKSIFEVEPDSVKRKLKDKAFARGVNRDDVRKGAEELGVPIEEHIAFCIAAMRDAADALGLRGPK